MTHPERESGDDEGVPLLRAVEMLMRKADNPEEDRPGELKDGYTELNNRDESTRLEALLRGSHGNKIIRK